MSMSSMSKAGVSFNKAGTSGLNYKSTPFGKVGTSTLNLKNNEVEKNMI